MKVLYKGKKGLCSLYRHRDFLYIHIPPKDGKKRQVLGCKLKYLAKEECNSDKEYRSYKDNYDQAIRKINSIDFDIVNGTFDSSLAKYKDTGKKRPVKVVIKDKYNLVDLYQMYIDFKKDRTSPSTHRSIYQYNLKIIERSPYKEIEDATKLLLWCNSKLKPTTCKRFMVQMNASFKYAQAVGILNDDRPNPFVKIIPTFKSKAKEQNQIDYYTTEQRDRLIYVIKSLISQSPDKVKMIKYYLIIFLFYTGMRPSEAIALTWNDINFTDNVIIANKAYVGGVNGLVLKQGLKTQDQRLIPMSPQCIELLNSVFNLESNLESKLDLIFYTLSKDGRKIPLEINNLSNRVWKGLFKDDRIKDSIPCYDLYSTRRTFITLALDAGYESRKVAKIVGNSSNVIYNHYAGTSKKIKLVDF